MALCAHRPRPPAARAPPRPAQPHPARVVPRPRRRARVAPASTAPDAAADAAPADAPGVPPKPGSEFVTRPAHQTTVATSFTLGGVGLHSGLYAYARVRPAAAGEGRYFCVVPPGTNAKRYVPNLNAGSPAASPGSEDSPQLARLYAAYLASLDAAAAGGGASSQEGGFEAWRDSPAGRAAAAAAPGVDYSSPAAAYLLPTPAPDERDERVLRRGGGGADVIEIEASLAAATPIARNRNLKLTAADGAASVACVDDVLAALEGMGVTNARIEVEAGHALRQPLPHEPPRDARHVELPAGDGSPLPWAVHIQRVGVVAAREGGGGGDTPPRVAAPAPRVAAPLTLTTPAGAFAAFIPDGTPSISAGVADDGTPVVGRQWAAWAPGAGEDATDANHHFRWQLAPARGWLPSAAAQLDARLADGLFKAGSYGVLLVGAGRGWSQERHERFPGDEPARHAAARALAVLALLAAPGGSGLPDGHVVTFNADAELLLRLAAGLAERAVMEEA